MGWPDFNGLINEIWGVGDDGASFASLTCAANIVVGQNPPYSASDFLALFPKWGGAPVAITATTDGTTGVLTAVSSTQGLAIGQLVAGPGIGDGSTILAIGTTTLTLSQATTAAATGQQVMIYNAMLLPLAIINAYVYLAQNSIFQVRWCEMWAMAMGFFIDHYLTLWARGQASGPNSTAAQAAASGLATGIQTSKSVGDVSVGIQPLLLDAWGSFALTLSGQQLATWGNFIGSGIQVIY
jgi:hypothetical protein